jgi:hypothetical protein
MHVCAFLIVGRSASLRPGADGVSLKAGRVKISIKMNNKKENVYKVGLRPTLRHAEADKKRL